VSSVDTLSGPRAAHRLSHIIEAVSAAHGTPRFPVDVRKLALESATIFGWSDPITKIEAADIKGFEGALFPDEERMRWLLLYNNTLSSTGRVRFTQAHELGHYIIHRTSRDAFQCSTAADMRNWSLDDQDIESQADEFASYLLMPLDDFRQQVNVDVDLNILAHCADRYGVSLTAAILKWLSYTDQKAVFIVSTDGYINWARSSTPAAKSGAFFRSKGNVIPLPAGTLALDDSVRHERVGANVPAKFWFPHAHKDLSLREMKISAEQYGSVLTLLSLPPYAEVWPDQEFS
jgi:uncharacterized protein (DUF952 family)